MPFLLEDPHAGVAPASPMFSSELCFCCSCPFTESSPSGQVGCASEAAGPLSLSALDLVVTLSGMSGTMGLASQILGV